MTQSPPQNLRLKYYLFEVRVPPTWFEWAERDIASTTWLVREILRLLVCFAVVSLIFGRFEVDLRTGVVLAVGIGVIIAAQGFLRKIALAYQSYGWDWGASSKVPSPYLRAGLALIFSVVLVLLTR